MSYYPNICEYYNTGMCVYVNGRYGIFEPCIFEKFPEAIKKIGILDCLQKKVIERMEKYDLERKVLS